MRGNQVLLVPSITTPTPRMIYLSTCLRTFAPSLAPGIQDSLAYPGTPKLTAVCGQKPGP